MTTLQTIIDNSNIDHSLIESTIEQFGGIESFKESATDICNHGIDGGFSGFIYYSETIPFAEANLTLILAYAREMADQLGVDGAYSLIAGFKCLYGDFNADDIADIIHDKSHNEYGIVMNAIAWFIGEEVARAYCDTINQ